MVLSIEKVGECLNLGEGPYWDVKTQTLFLVDIPGKTIHKYVPATKQFTTAHVEGPVSFILPVEGTTDQFVITKGRQLIKIEWDGVNDNVKELEVLTETDKDVPTNRINDGKADPLGRVWFGTMGREFEGFEFEMHKGSLFSYSKNKKLHVHDKPISLSNGLEWNPSLKKFYYIDTLEKRIVEYDYDLNNGTISNKKPIFTFEKHNIDGLPDGMTIDTDGNLWVAAFNGSSVLKIDPRKPETLLDTLTLPAKQITSVAFGGPNLDELYVTSARVGGLTAADGHGYTYVVKGLGVKGLPAVAAKI